VEHPLEVVAVYVHVAIDVARSPLVHHGGEHDCVGWMVLLRTRIGWSLLLRGALLETR
jgi:hypothetical protein